MHCIVVTPAGRQVYLKHLYMHLKKQKEDFDVWHIWDNTRNDDDYKYIRELSKNNAWIRIVERKNILKGSTHAIRNFFDYCHKKDTIYIRLDDDIIWLEDNFIKNLKTFTQTHPQFPIVFATILNNAVIAHLQQKEGNVLQKLPELDGKCMGNYWSYAYLSHRLHEEFKHDRLYDKIDKWHIKNYIVKDFRKISINAIAWIGQDFFKHWIYDTHEEPFLTKEYPRILNAPNCIYGRALCLHHAFFTQRDIKVNGVSLDERLQEFT